MRKGISTFLAIAMVFVFISGCASKYGKQKTVVRYYPGCYQPIKDLRSRENTTAKGAATGAVVGTLSGALIGAISGSWRGVATGAAAGGIMGATTGGLHGEQQKDTEETKLLAAYLQEIDGDISNLDLPKAAAKISLMCYDKQFKNLVTDIKAKTITYAAAQERFEEITNGRDEAYHILGELPPKSENIKKEYQDAFSAK